MNAYLIVGLLLTCIATGGIAYWRGYEHGELSAHASVMQQAIDANNVVMQKARDLVNTANAQAITLRQQAAQREVVHERTTQALRAALKRLAAHDQCLSAPIDAGLLHELTTARDHAAERAATGTADAAVPATGSAAGVAGHE